MSDTKQVLRETRDRIPPPHDVLGTLERRRRHREHVRRASGAVVGIVVALVGLGGWFVVGGDGAQRQADRGTRALGIFAPGAGRIVYQKMMGGHPVGLYAVDPAAPMDPTSLVQLSNAENAEPLGWSREGTELLSMRTVPGERVGATAQRLSILHADGSETQLTADPMSIQGATLSPDGSRVVFAGWTEDRAAIYTVDAEGGRPIALLHEGTSGGLVSAPTFSPDGSQIAYVDGEGDHDNGVWVMDADGSDAHQIVANDRTPLGHVFGLAWSPSGDRIALGLRWQDSTSRQDSAIYTFAPDGSDFRRVVTPGYLPYWSPDGSEIAYSIDCWKNVNPHGCPSTAVSESVLAVADADGSNVRTFDFATSGPWHPIDLTAADQTPPSDHSALPALRRGGELIASEGEDLVAVDPDTGQSRILLEGSADEEGQAAIPVEVGGTFEIAGRVPAEVTVDGVPIHAGGVGNAAWSPDSKWLAFDLVGLVAGSSLWVVNADLEPRLLAVDAGPWAWSPTGAQLVVMRGSVLTIVDVSSGRETGRADVVGDVTSAPAWSPDGTRIVFGARGGAIYSVDVGSSDVSLLARLPGNLDSVDGIGWSPNGANIAVLADLYRGRRRLFVMDADGSRPRVLVDDFEPGGWGTFIASLVQWSPDGTRLAYANFSGPDERDLEIWTVPVDGSSPSLVTSHTNDECCIDGGGPIWSPDGTQIAFETDRRPVVVNADGTGGASPIDELTYRSWQGGWYFCFCYG